MSDVAALVSGITGRDLRRIVVSDADYRADLVAHGAPGPAADMLVGLFAAARRGDFAPPTPPCPAWWAARRRHWSRS